MPAAHPKPQHPDFDLVATTTQVLPKLATPVASQSPQPPSPAANAGLTVLPELFPTSLPVCSKLPCPTECPREAQSMHLKPPMRQPHSGQPDQREPPARLAPPPPSSPGARGCCWARGRVSEGLQPLPPARGAPCPWPQSVLPASASRAGLRPPLD